MHHTRLAVLTIAVMLAIVACSSTSTSATSVPASVNPSTAAPSEAAPAATGGAVSIANFSFQPATITVPVGTMVTWTNNDGGNHTDRVIAAVIVGPGVTVPTGTVIVAGWKLKLAIETAPPVAAGAASEGAAVDGLTEAGTEVAGVDVLEQATIASMARCVRTARRCGASRALLSLRPVDRGATGRAAPEVRRVVRFGAMRAFGSTPPSHRDPMSVPSGQAGDEASGPASPWIHRRPSRPERQEQVPPRMGAMSSRQVRGRRSERRAPRGPASFHRRRRRFGPRDGLWRSGLGCGSLRCLGGRHGNGLEGLVGHVDGLDVAAELGHLAAIRSASSPLRKDTNGSLATGELSADARLSSVFMPRPLWWKAPRTHHRPRRPTASEAPRSRGRGRCRALRLAAGARPCWS